jgi:hypothetical protein
MIQRTALLLPLLLLGCTSPRWTLQVTTDVLEFRTTEPYPGNLEKLAELRAMYDRMKAMFALDVAPPEPVRVDHLHERGLVSRSSGREWSLTVGPSENYVTHSPEGVVKRIQLDGYWSRSILLHELAHLMLLLGWPERAMDSWLHEGLATWFESAELRGADREIELRDFEAFARIAEGIAPPGAPPFGAIFTVSHAEFHGQNFGHYAYRSAALIAYAFEQWPGENFRARLERLLALGEPELRRLERQAVARYAH